MLKIKVKRTVKERVLNISSDVSSNFKKYNTTIGRSIMNIIFELNDKTRKRMDKFLFFCFKKYKENIKNVSGIKSNCPKIPIE